MPPHNHTHSNHYTQKHTIL